jgi:putative nucleotidyltransferase with HDIG domain
MDVSSPHTDAAELIDAAKEVASFPASREAIARLRNCLDSDATLEDVARATEASMALTLAVMRVANGRRTRRGTVTDVPHALDQLDRGTLLATIDSIPEYEVLDGSPDWDLFPENLRVHATAVRSVAERVAAAVGHGPSAELRAGALLHDVGKPLIYRAYGDRAEQIYADQHMAPEVETQRERSALGIDHAAAGAWLLRHWQFPTSLADTVGQHHSRYSAGDAAVIRVADMLVHYSQGDEVDMAQLREAGERLGLRPDQLSELMYELPDGFVASPRTSASCPLSSRELDVLRQLAEGKVYKQIAQDLGLSPSTVRSHLNRAYRRMGVADRTQAVLLASEQGWL